MTKTDIDFNHIPVLLRECLDGLMIKPDGIYLDCTLGGGGHSYHIAGRLTTGRLIGFDRDSEAIDAATRRLAPYADRFTAVHRDYRYLSEELDRLDIRHIDGALFDLGVSSHQLDSPRGFSYKNDQVIDMRMDRSAGPTAADLINTLTKAELARILREYGEEAFAGPIAAAIVRERDREPIHNTARLTDIIVGAIPAGAARREKQHPARRSYMALRIATNTELDAAAAGLAAALDRLSPGGRVCCITFHSLEDRICKRLFRDRAAGCICDKSLPQCICGHVPEIKLINKSPILPSPDELQQNPRSASAKLRIAEKI